MKNLAQVNGLEDCSAYGYSHFVRRGPLIFLAGQCGLSMDHEVVSQDFAAQCQAALDRVRRVLEAAGAHLDDIVSMTVYITDARLGRIFTDMRREYFTEPYPASALVAVSQLMPLGAKVEIQAIAYSVEASGG